MKGSEYSNSKSNTNSNKTQTFKSNSNSKDSNKSDGYLKEKVANFLNKRKILFQKHKQQKDKYNEIVEISELEDLDREVKLTERSSNREVKITNIIVNNTNGKPFDIKAPDMMLRDIKSLNLITQKALTTISKCNPVDSIDDDKKSFMNFNTMNSRKALFIDDNSDMPAGICRTVSNGEFPNKSNSAFSGFNGDLDKGHIINIININNNYNIGNMNYTKTPSNMFKYQYDNMKKHFSTSFKRSGTSQPESAQDSAKSNNMNKTSIKNSIPKTKQNKSIKEVINAYQKPQTTQSTKEKFVRINK